MLNFRQLDSIPFIPAKGSHIPDSYSIQQWGGRNGLFYVFFRIGMFFFSNAIARDDGMAC